MIRHGPHPLFWLTLISWSCIGYAQRAEVKFIVVEETPVNSIVGNVLNEAELPLQGIEVRIYKTNEQMDSLFEFSPHTPGELRIAKRLDREQLCPSSEECLLNLSLIANDERHTNEIWIKLLIDVVDINDSRARFTQKLFVMEIPENQSPAQSVIDLPRAIDDDTRKYGVSAYSLESADKTHGSNWQDLFSLSANHQINIHRELDFEDKPAYDLLLVAFEAEAPGDAQPARLPIRILVRDQNDNAPVFTSPNLDYRGSFSLNLSESTAITSPIIRFVAHDRDTNDNGQVSYRLAQRSDHISIDSITGDVRLLRPLKAHETQLIRTTVVASDHGSPPRQVRFP
ncbi:putative calcium-dependent cell-adhesion protein [Cichlidogyrus casuarinus]|uniref:Calcium-dependent cell-adhesion protein n=1 Tax=Cichlidogyrus casuarinus TaxID=1844966 RepID=A0ABD2Q7L7_9PLAT